MFKSSGCEAKNNFIVPDFLVKKLNSLPAFGIAFAEYKLWLGIALLFCQVTLQAQDTISLKAVEIDAPRTELSKIGKRLDVIDSAAKERNGLNNLGDLLSNNSTLFIKNYGPGSISTTSFRGGNASQTGVLWNGINIQNMLLGQGDLSLIPSILFESVEVEYGGSSSLWGSGAVGGSIHLQNKSLFRQGTRAFAHLGSGTMGQTGAATGFLYSKEKLISNTKIYFTGSENNFSYLDTSDKQTPYKKQKSGEYSFTGLMQELKFLLNPKQLISVNAWLNRNKRHLPGYDLQEKTKTYQYDAAARLTANWTYTGQKFKSQIRGAFLNDVINYDDSLLVIHSKSRVQNVIVENENYSTWKKNNQLNFGINYTHTNGVSDNYIKRNEVYKLALLLGNKFSLLKNKLVAYAAARLEYFSAGAIPLTGNISAQYQITEKCILKANAARVYRQPTLNELYWFPGGNPKLKPEDGLAYDGSFEYKRSIKKVNLFVSGAVFSRQMNNWILWLPQSFAGPSPVNLQKVWSRGTETNCKLNYHYKHWKLDWCFMSAYVLSTLEASSQEGGNTIKKQLIYTPRYTFSGNFSVTYQKTNLTYYQNYIGYRFITSDNSNWLSPYHISSIRFSHSFSSGATGFALYFACNNLFNTNYNIIAGKPMPLRNFEFGITLKTKNRNNQNN